MEITLHRSILDPKFSLGELLVNGVRLGYTCEDADRKLEDGGEKVYGKTAIPRGRYQVILSFSNRFQRVMPEIVGVPGYSGVRIHGGNTDADTLGCPLLGRVRTPDGVRDCPGVNVMLTRMIGDAESHGEESWISVE